MANMVTITIDGRQLTVPAGTLVIEAAKQAGIDIPAFCYYEGFSVQAACRMCLVEVEKMPKLQPACALPAADGMVIHTESPKVVEAQRVRCSSSCSPTIRSTAPSATRAASASYRT